MHVRFHLDQINTALISVLTDLHRESKSSSLGSGDRIMSVYERIAEIRGDLRKVLGIALCKITVEESMSSPDSYPE